jgi:hypothetical protein
VLHPDSHVTHQVYGTQTVGLIMGVANACVGGAMMIVGIAVYATSALHEDPSNVT